MTDFEPGLSVPPSVAAPHRPASATRPPPPAPVGFGPRLAAQLGDASFLNDPLASPQTKKIASMWLVYAVAGFLVGQLGATIFGQVAGSIAGKSAAQMSAIASANVPPEWYVVSTLLGLWVGFIGAPWLASRTQGTRHVLRDLGLRFAWVDLLGVAIGIGGQLLITALYYPFRHDIHDFNAPSQKLTGGSHGFGFFVIAVATVVLAPAAEEIFFRGLLFKALARLCTPIGLAKGRGRTIGIALAVVADGLLFGLAHGELVQLAGLAIFGMMLAAVSYRTGRLGMNMVAHGTFNLVAVLFILHSRGSVIL